MSRNRLETFSDSMIAILMTIMVLQLKVPGGPSLEALRPVLPLLLEYALSFIYLAIYWNNHHHMFYMVHQINGKILWANMHLLFWLSLVPFTTEWIGDDGLKLTPTLAYGCVLSLAAFAYYILERTIIASQGADSMLQKAIGYDLKAKISIVLYVLALPLVFLSPFISMGIYAIVALIWLIPDRRIESKVTKS